MPDVLSNLRPRFSLAGLLIALTLACGGALFVKSYLESRPPTWIDYSPQKLSKFQKEGRTILLNFQADWDVSSKINRRMIDRPQVSRWIRRNGVVTMRADLTKPSTRVTAELQKLNRDSVPVIAIFRAEDPGPPRVIDGVVTDRQLLNVLQGVEQP